MSEMEFGFEQTMKKKSGGGCLMVFGLPFFLIGLFIMLTALGGTGLEVDEDTPALFLIIFGSVFGSVGAALMFGRSGITIDRTKMTVTKWWGLLVPMKVTVFDLNGFDRITVGKEVRSDSNSSKTVFPVRLAGGRGIDDLEYDAPGDYPAARRLSEEIARFVRLDIEDSMSGLTVHRRLEELDESVRDRLRRTRERIPLPGAPWEMKATIGEEAGGTVVDLPPPGLKPSNLAPIIPALFMAAMVGIFFLPSLLSAGTPPGTQLIFGGFVGFFFIFLPVVVTLGSALRKARFRVTITASREMLRVEEGVGRRRKVTEIPGPELEEFELVGQKDIFDTAIREAGEDHERTGEEQKKIQRMLAPDSMLGKLARMATKSQIVARSDTVTIRFGRDIPDEELIYLHAIILRALT